MIVLFCPKCGSTDISIDKGGYYLVCNGCGQQHELHTIKFAQCASIEGFRIELDCGGKVLHDQKELRTAEGISGTDLDKH